MNYILKTYIIVFLTFLLFQTNIFGQNIVINEFMSDNESVLQDEDGDFSDWIELYNSSNNTINLLNYRLSDDSSNLNKWVFPWKSIPPHSFLMVFASGKNRIDTTELHTNFKIAKSGENLLLCNSGGEIISSTAPVSLPPDNSYGCVNDGNQFMCTFKDPTPNISNSGSYGIYSSHTSGFHNDSFYLSLIQSDDNLEIYYTLNGGLPTINSLTYSSPLHITSNISSPYTISSIPTTPMEGPYPLSTFIWKEPESVYKANVVRFASFDNDTMRSCVYTKTFFVDPDIETRYTFPIISLVTDSLNLFDYDTGIYIPGNTFDENGFNWWPSGNYHNRGPEWERDIHISYFENDGIIGFETDAGMRMRGYGSTVNPQKSFGVYFRNDYGLNKINFPVFENSNTNKYKRLIFRNSGNDFLFTHFKDALLQGLLMSLDLELQQFQPAVMFFNGEYWGIHNIREKYDKYYFKYHFGIDEDNINILGICGGIKEGENSDYLELVNFVEVNDMSLNENYLFAKNKVDIQNFIDFQIAEIFYANYDWPCNNFNIWKTNDPGSKWRFLIFDLDYSFGFNINSSFDTHSFEHATSTNNGWPYCECSNLLFRKFLENDEFEQQFVDRFAYHLNNTFSSTLVFDSIDKYELLFNPEMVEHIARWGYPPSIDNWQEHIQTLRDFAQERPCFIREDIMDFFDLTAFDFVCYTGIKKLNSSKLVLAPNPSNGKFYLNNNSLNTIKVSVTITSVSGKLVYAESELVLVGNTRQYINLTGLPNNTYIIHLFNENYSERRKIVVVK